MSLLASCEQSTYCGQLWKLGVTERRAGGCGGRSAAGMSATTAACVAGGSPATPPAGAFSSDCRSRARCWRRSKRAGCRIGEGTLLEPGCWLTLAPQARIEIGAGCFLNRNTMLAAYGADRDRRPHDVRQRLLRRRRRSPLRRPEPQSPGRASPRRARSRSAPTAGSASTAWSPAASPSAIVAWSAPTPLSQPPCPA